MTKGVLGSKERSGLSSTTLILLIANLLAILFFVTGDGSIMQVLWIFWAQSVIIGVVNVARITTLGSAISPSVGTQASRLGDVTVKSVLAAFFILHYGLFHLVYAIFLAVFTYGNTTFNDGPSPFTAADRAVNIWLVLLTSMIFALHHFISYKNEVRERSRHSAIANIAVVMITPYLRVVVMHIIIILGPFIAIEVGAKWLFIPFMILKTMVDLALHKRGTSHTLPNNRSSSYHLDKLVEAQHNQDIK